MTIKQFKELITELVKWHNDWEKEKNLPPRALTEKEMGTVSSRKWQDWFDILASLQDERQVIENLERQKTTRSGRRRQAPNRMIEE